MQEIFADGTEQMRGDQTEIIVTNSAGEVIATLTNFSRHYRECGENLKNLCVEASLLSDFNWQVFRDYVTCILGLSRVTAVQMINAGHLYREREDLICFTHTKVVELVPVREQLEYFFEYIGEGPEELSTKSQKDIRDKVKGFTDHCRKQLRSLEEDYANEFEEAASEDPEEEAEEPGQMIRETWAEVYNFLDELKPGKVISKADAENIRNLLYSMQCIYNQI